MKKQYCSGRVYGGRIGVYCCTRTGVVFEDGKYWCRQHAPSAVKERREKSEERYTIKSREEAKEWHMRYKAIKLLNFCENSVYSLKNTEDINLFIEKIKIIIEVEERQ